MTEAIKKHKYDFLIPWYFVMFFVALICVDGTIIYLAMTTHRGVVDKNAYVNGLDYNDTINAYNEQQKTGWKSNIVLQDNSVLKVSLVDKSGEFLKDAKILATIFRPTQAGHDFEAVFTENTENTNIYSANIDFPLKGLWQVRLLAVKDGKTHKDSKRIVVK